MFLLAALALIAAERGAPEAGVVKITATVDGKKKTGTGFIVKLEQDIAYIVTAAHVVEGDKVPQVEFYSMRGRGLKAGVQQLEEDNPRGLALLTVDKPPSAAAVLPVSATTLKARDEVEAIGFPAGAGPWAVIPARLTSREGGEWVLSGQIDEGNSGGPMLKNGEVVGVVTRVQNGFGRANSAASLREVLEGWGVALVTVVPSQAESGQERVRSSSAPAPASDAPSRTLKGARRVATLTGHETAVFALALSASGKRLASASRDGTLILWDTTTRKSLGAPFKYQKQVTDLAFRADDKSIASLASAGGQDASIILIAGHRAVGQPLEDERCRGGIWGVAFSPDGKTLAAACENDTVVLWDVAQRSAIGDFGTECDAPLRPAFSPDGGTLAVGTTDGCIVLWNTRTRTLLGSLSERINGATVLAVAFSPDGKTLASGSTTNGSEVLMWDLGSRQISGEPMKGHTKHVSSLAFSSDGSTLVSGSADHTLMLWNVAARKPIADPLKGHTDAVMRVALSPDGKTIASASLDKTVILWELEYQ